jgi:hypothetical protein
VIITYKFIQEHYDLLLICCESIPKRDVTFNCDVAASLSENRWVSSISDLAKTMALLKSSMAMTRFPLQLID